MKISYLALLRGINVGGNNMIKMSDLRGSLTQAGFQDVRTFIQSGNVLFQSAETDASKLVSHIEALIRKQWKIEVAVAVFSKHEWQQILLKAPKAWGKDPEWKHNLLVLLKPYDMASVIADISELKPGIERLVPGDGVLYQSMSRELFGRTTTGKLASKAVYKRMTVRNYNTAQKLLSLM